jgi:stage II sporulation protein AA (anti-sigma F factor antagonist)
VKVKVFKQHRDAVVVVLEGEYDALGVSATRPEFERLINDELGEVIVDVAGVSFMDSSGAGSLVFLHKRLAERQRALELVGATGQPLELLTLLRITNVIPVNQTLVIRPEPAAGPHPGE